ncbi:DUF4235 domain-containing protein [Litorihabitans aurantiacus]|uniref:DUF4235 domain-containing protein n=1 Tax=Litorihabitans aurantiacus TaxID=1930061 RepID=A0AA38CR39_9MICO|nr:DUF4235 domain-containing protein [Litorihabitans aurantiacus]GMA32753.1 hypothetical protein GCM10025875_27450 [Litorihabitans aurantiacus]
MSSETNQKIVTTLAVMAAGFVATKALSLVWRKVTGHEPPSHGDDASVRELVVFAAISGALAALARAGTTRAVTRAIAKRVDDAV